MGRGNSSSTPQADEREVVNWNGPLKKHSCTDIICLLLFLVFLAAWGFVAFMAFKDGDISKVSFLLFGTRYTPTNIYCIVERVKCLSCYNNLYNN